jgi:hypothetical protein
MGKKFTIVVTKENTFCLNGASSLVTGTKITGRLELAPQKDIRRQQNSA